MSETGPWLKTFQYETRGSGGEVTAAASFTDGSRWKATSSGADVGVRARALRSLLYDQMTTKARFLEVADQNGFR